MKKLLFAVVFLAAFVIGSALTPAAAASKTYIVQQGDSLWKISQQFKIPFADIMAANKNLKDPALIYPHQKIILPSGSGTSTAAPSHSDNIAQGNASAIAGSVEAKENAVLKLVNEARAKEGLKPLSMSTKLIDLAEMKARDMAEKNYFSHTSPTYGTPFQMLQKYGVSYRTAGENIAAGQGTAEAVMRDWLNSTGHRANIMNPNFTEIGVGYYKGGSYRTEWVQLFIGN